MRRVVLAKLCGLAVVACSAPPHGSAPTPSPVHAAVAANPQPAHPQLDGRGFPDHVLSLTWDDGPDDGTLRLAGYLASEHVSGTFFVVEEWSHDLSEEPGQGPHPFETGFAYLPILGDLVALGHRLGNHTANHVILSPATAVVVDFELRENQRRIDPFLGNELRLFRAPGGRWSEETGRVLDGDAALNDLVGPLRWDIDGKDWEGSLYCRSEEPAIECEPTPGGGRRVRAEVTARRYLDSVAQAGRGVVLFHDRVGDVGSDYALRVATRVIPELKARGYVFAPPVLTFSPFRSRIQDSMTAGWLGSVDSTTVTLRDINGDGRADLCGRGARGLSCAHSVEHVGAVDDPRPVMVFEWTLGGSTDAPLSDGAGAGSAASRELRGDLNGDGRDDMCSVTREGVSCALAAPRGLLAASVWLGSSREDDGPWLAGVLSLADVNGDGRADLCSVLGADVACALAP